MINLASLLNHTDTHIVYNFISSMIEESKYCSDTMKTYFNKKVVMINDYVDNDVKVRDHCNITGKTRAFAHRDCTISVKLNHKIPVVFQNLKKYNSHNSRDSQ